MQKAATTLPWDFVGDSLGMDSYITVVPVRLAYQPPASSTFLSHQTSHQPAVLFSQNKPTPAISYQPTKQVLNDTSLLH
jgi:hypothetical protein